ncbi:hypothetical protein RGQ29_021940 [Quercus rubra]|uniref:Major facilitator superfamily (MFS) profile domain-containing protein n=1 Tax=Quercus rubra TaxID=3512 RepID=A0AAN7INL1_QUERU|nr:hypothetical protein RGQ29_021940 [Quercus rubra]
MKSEALTLVLVNVAGIMERADEALLPGVYKEVGEALRIDPTGLGSLTLFRSLMQSLCYPIAAYLALRHNRAHVIALGAFLWAAATFCVAISSTFFQQYNRAHVIALGTFLWAAATFLFAISSNFFEVAVSRGLNGIGLAIVIPAIQSLVADSTDASNRGLAFGLLQLTANLGSIFGGSAVLIASKSVMGVAGWRIAFHMVEFISVIVGILVLLFANDPRFSKSDSGARNQVIHKPFWSNVKELIQEAKSVITIPSFQILVLQGVSGSIPGSAFSSFAPMWLQLIGFSSGKLTVLLAIIIIGNSFGGVFGGWMGDNLAKCLPNSGRIVLSQISSASLVPTAAFLLLVLPDDPSTAFMHGLALFIMAFFASWEAAATNNPIFAEIVPEKSRTSIYALDRSFETIVSSFAPAVVGIFAQKVYGYRPIPKGSSTSAEIETDRQNAAPLAKALYTAIGIPAAICCFIYSFLYCTYPRDREHARMYVLIESEMQRIEADNSLSGQIDIDDEGLDDNNAMSSLL